MDETELKFIGLLTKADLTAEKFSQRQTAREAGLASMRAELDTIITTPDGKQMPLRESIRAGMTFNVVDRKGRKKDASFHKDGQEHAMDTHDSVSKGHGLSKEDQPRVQKAMEQALALVDKLRSQKGPDGEPLYDDGDLMEEVFTPLMREGLLPDNFILDKYSATHELLAATFGRYNKALKEAQAAKAKKRDLDTVDLGGANGKLGTLKAVGAKASAMKDQMQKRLMAKTGLSEDAMRRIKLGGGIVKSVASFVKTNKSELGDVIPDEWSEELQKLVKPVEEHLESAKDALNADLDKHAHFLLKPAEKLEEMVEGIFVEKPDSSEDAPKPSAFKKLVLEIQGSRAMEVFDHFAEQLKDKIEDNTQIDEFLNSAGDRLSDLAEKVELHLDRIPFFRELDNWAHEYTEKFDKMCLQMLKGLATSVAPTIKDSVDIGKLDDDLKKSDQGKQTQAAVRDAVHLIDAGLSEAAGAVDSVLGVALSGQYIKRTKISDAAEAAVESPANGKKIVEVFAAGIVDMFAGATPPPTDPPDGTEEAFKKMGGAIATAFRGKANADQLTAALKDNAVAGLGVLVAAARSAAAKELGTLGGTDAATDVGAAAAFKQTVKDPAKQQALLAQGTVPDADEAEDEIQKSDEELRSYEDSLMLIDEGGFDAAQARNIEVLIHDLQKNRKTLEMVAGLGQRLLGAGGKALKPIIDSGLGGHATDAIKLAKMILQLAVNTKKAADRWILWYKFRSSLERSKKAVSALTSTIQGFFNNKREQIAFHTIDDAMTAIQIAGTIVGMVPEPITMGVGKTMNLLAAGAQVANQVAGKVYNEAMLTKAWKTTLLAINNPGNRKAGLAALRLNPTLGMHAVAWAGAERQPPDPIARMLMDRLGVNAQTIAAGCSGDQLMNYLKELLNEDRQIERSTGAEVDWIPAKFTLCARDFFSISTRASQKATPKLRLAGEKTVVDALKALDSHALDKLAPDAVKGEIPQNELTTQLDEAEKAQEALKNYRPRCEDGSEHEEMANVQAQFLSLITAHVNQLEALDAQNSLARLQRATAALQEELTANASLPDDVDEETLTNRIEIANTVLDKITGQPLVADDPDVKDLSDQLAADIQRLRDQLATL